MEEQKKFKVKMNGSKHQYKLPLFCPVENCKRITGTVDDKYLLEYGICSHCYIQYVENRQTPLLDVQYYRQRLTERGY